MTIHAGKKSNKIEIDLLGPEGNAMCILAQARNLTKQLGYKEEETDELLDRMKSGSYKNLVDVFEAEFSFLVNIYNYKEVFLDA